MTAETPDIGKYFAEWLAKHPNPPKAELEAFFHLLMESQPRRMSAILAENFLSGEKLSETLLRGQ